ncbi:MAG: hypothetical protein P8P85_10870, partial [Acidimicrobiales bacterium]|nr:hypothetical protein [Acidimicrobiales bacterium]
MAERRDVDQSRCGTRPCGHEQGSLGSEPRTQVATSPAMRCRLLLILFIVFALLATACGGGDEAA